MNDTQKRAREREAIVLAAIEAKGHPVTPHQMRQPLKEKGHDIGAETIRHILDRMWKRGQLVKFPGENGKVWTVFGLDGMTTEGLDRSMAPPSQRRHNAWRGW